MDIGWYPCGSSWGTGNCGVKGQTRNPETVGGAGTGLEDVRGREAASKRGSELAWASGGAHGWKVES